MHGTAAAVLHGNTSARPSTTRAPGLTASVHRGGTGQRATFQPYRTARPRVPIADRTTRPGRQGAGSQLTGAGLDMHSAATMASRGLRAQVLRLQYRPIPGHKTPHASDVATVSNGNCSNNSAATCCMKEVRTVTRCCQTHSRRAKNQCQLSPCPRCSCSCPRWLRLRH